MNRENQTDDILFDLLKTAGDLSKEAAPSWKQKMLAPTLLGLSMLPGAGCSKPPCPPSQVEQKQEANMFHVISADPCELPSVVGIIGNKEYSLNLRREDRDLGVACPNVGGFPSMKNVGKNFA